MLRPLGRHALTDAKAARARWLADRRGMTPEEAADILHRNVVASVVQELNNGRVRTRRSRYAYGDDGLYLPAWGHPKWFRRDPPVILECQVSELHGLEEWRYVWARGAVTPLQPSDDTAENEAWQAGLAWLRRTSVNGSRVAETGPPHYGVLRLEILTLDGVVLSLA